MCEAIYPWWLQLYGNDVRHTDHVFYLRFMKKKTRVTANVKSQHDTLTFVATISLYITTSGDRNSVVFTTSM